MVLGCLWYCKSTIFQANHNNSTCAICPWHAVCDTAKVRFFKQITTRGEEGGCGRMLFVILQKYDFSSKSQHNQNVQTQQRCCLWYCKSTIFQANHNYSPTILQIRSAVCDTAKVRFFKQITTRVQVLPEAQQLFVILQKYDFSSKSQQVTNPAQLAVRCLWYCKSTIFQANHNSTR